MEPRPKKVAIGRRVSIVWASVSLILFSHRREEEAIALAVRYCSWASVYSPLARQADAPTPLLLL